jgi:secondary thiamine-phosphate synthase enzyme
MRTITLRTERSTELVDITAQVREAIDGAKGAAALVYVPHTSAAVTINEKIDPVLVADLERMLGSIVEDSWEWNHCDEDGPNAPSHARATVVGPQVVIPLDESGALALGTYQGIFFCEFDGPRDRRIHVAVLQ